MNIRRRGRRPRPAPTKIALIGSAFQSGQRIINRHYIAETFRRNGGKSNFKLISRPGPETPLIGNIRAKITAAREISDGIGYHF
jgi:hypothetical protein